MRTFQQGLTLLEVLIALSIFSLIGVASYQVLSTTISSQQRGDQYSRQLALQQRAISIVDRDLQQIIARAIRISSSEKAAALRVNDADYPLEFTRAGRRNPLMMPRSSMQRVAYDVGLHPEAANRDSRHYQDERTYLRRHLWTALDRTEQARPLVQVVLPDIAEIEVAVLTEEGRQQQWPLPKRARQKARSKPLQPLAIELTLTTSADEQITRIYPVL